MRNTLDRESALNNEVTNPRGKSHSWRHWLRWGAIIIGYYCWFQALYNNIHHGTVYPYRTPEEAFLFISYNFIPIVFIFLMNLFIVFKIDRHRNMKVKVILDIILSFTGAVMVNVAYLLICGMFREVYIDWTGTILNDILILLMVEAVYYFQNFKESQLRAQEAGKRILQYKYDTLKAQINPHFLFNSLSLLSSLVTIDPAKAKKFILELANMYRYIMTQQGIETVTVANELDFLQSYLQVLEMRYGNKFRVEFCGEAPEYARIVPYTMQLLIENVTKHNVISSKMPMVVTVELGDKGISVSNPVSLRPTKNNSGIGLRYLKSLYESHGEHFQVNNDGSRFTALIPYITHLNQ